jgi:hypothetical protein
VRRRHLTALAVENLSRAVVARRNGGDGWIRSRTAGDRPSLAALHTRGLLERRVWRTARSDADRAFEYRITRAGMLELRDELERRQVTR